MISVMGQRALVAATGYYIRASIVAARTLIWVWENRTLVQSLVLLGEAGLEIADYITGMVSRWGEYEDNPPQGPVDRGLWAEKKSSANLGGWFPVIDDYNRDLKLATSMKTHSAESPEALVAKIEQDLRDMYGIESRELSGYDKDNVKRVIPAGAIERKALVVGVEEEMAPNVVSPWFRGRIEALSKRYKTTVHVSPIRGWTR